MGSAFLDVAGSNSMSSSTVYMPLSGSIGQGNHGTEAQAQVTLENAGTFKNMLKFDSAIGGTVSYHLRKNAVNGNLSISTSSSGTVEDTTHTDAIVAGDLVCYSYGGSSSTLQSWSVLFDATTDTSTRLNTTGDNAGYNNSGGSEYFTLGGRTTGEITTESQCKCRQRKAGSMQNMAIYINSWSRSGTDNYRDRLNGANGSLLAAVTGSGVWEDSVHSTTIAAGDDYCLSIALAASSSSGSLNQYGIDFVATDSSTQMCDSINSNVAFSSGSTQMLYVGGELMSNSTESQRQVKARVAYTYSNVTIGLASGSGTSTLTFRTGGVDQNETATVTGAGYFSDTTHTDVGITTDLINYKVAVGGSTITCIHCSLWGGTSVVTPIALTETKTITDSVKRKITRKIATQTITISEAIAKLCHFHKALTETTVISSVLAGGKVIKRAITETVTIAESKLRKFIPKIVRRVIL